MLVPMYFLIGVWGSDRRLYAAIKFFLYTLIGSVIMLLGILALYFKAGGGTFDIPTLLASAAQFDTRTQVLLFWAFFFAFAIKVPMFPFHTWLPDAHTEAPTAGSVILAGVLLKMGTYGFIRFSLPLLPQDAAARHKIVTIMLVVSVIGILYGALVCMMQPRPFHWRLVLDRRRTVRAEAHAANFGIWRALHSDAEFRRCLYDRHAQLAGLAFAQRVYR